MAACAEEPQCEPNCANKHCGDDTDDGCGGACIGFCGDRDTGCKNDADCPSGHACIRAGGPRLGLDADVNVCLPKVCSVPNQAVANCGTIDDPCGICPPVATDACVDRECGVDPTSGVTCGPSDVPCVDGKIVRKFGPMDVDLLSGKRKDLDELQIPALPVVEPLGDFTNKVPGAIAGAFAVDARGGATYTVPITVPPGRSGLQPELALTYNSRGGNGIAGMGWSVSGLSSIARCPKTTATDGARGAVRYDETDALCLDGARLIFVPKPGTQEGQHDAEYRTEIDSFQKIVLKGPAGAASASFVVYRKDGQIWEYGGTDKERLFRDPAPLPRVPRAWALSKIRDRAWNVISFRYGKLESSESRSGAYIDQETVEFFPDEIAYGGYETATASAGPRLQVKFSYVDGRRDYMEGFTSAGARITRTKLLKSIATFVADQPVRSYELSYVNATSGLEPSLGLSASGPSRVDEIHECSKKNGTRVCLPATKVTYTDERGFAPNTVVASAPPLLGPLVTLDANGDGFPDFLALGRTPNNAEWYPAPTTILVGNGSRSAPSFTSFSITPKVEVDPYTEDPAYPCFSQASVVDVDGDGRDELVDLCPHGRPSANQPRSEHYYWIYRFDGLGAPSEVEVVTVNSLSLAKPRAFLVDANGDGIKDLFECVAPDGESTRGEAFYFAGSGGGGPAFEAQPSGRIASSAMRGACGFFNHPKAGGRPIKVRPSPIVVQDLTGDGVADLLIHDPGEPAARGESLVSTAVWYRYTTTAAGVAYWDPVGSWAEPTNYKFLDVNGDGLRDVVSLAKTPQLSLNQGGKLISVGSLFPPNADPNLVRRLTAYSLQNSFAIDYDGDGAEDLLRLMDYKSEPAAAVSHWLWDRANTTAQSYGTLELDRAPLNLSDPSSFSLTVQPKVAPPVEIGGPTQTVADADGDGSVDLIQLKAGGGIAITYGHFGHENLLSSVTDGLGKRVDVKYDSRSTFSDGSVGPTYQVAPPAAARSAETPGLCALDENTRCMVQVGPVVSSFRVAGSAGEYGSRPDVAFHFRYEDARRGLRGRGWLGFGKVIVDKAQATYPETPIERTEVSRDNRTLVADGYLFPFAGRETSSVTTTPFAKSPLEKHSAARVETTTTAWETVSSTRGGLFPVPRNVLRRIDDLSTDGTSVNITEVSNSIVEVDGFGNVREAEIATSANGNRVSLQTVSTEFDADVSPEDTWLIALPTRRSVVEELAGDARLAAGKPDEERVTSWHYTDDGLLDYMLREPGEAEDSGLYLKTTFNRFEDLSANPARNVRNVTTTGSWTDADGQVISGTRAVSFQYDADAIAPRRVIRHVGNDCPINDELGDAQESGFGSTCLIEDMKFDPRDGTLTGGVDAAGVGFQMGYDAFGRILSRVAPDEETVYSYEYGAPSFDARLRLVPTVMEVVVSNKTTGSTSTRRIDSFGRTVQVESSGLDGDAVFQETAYEWGQVVDRISRPHLEDDASQGDVSHRYDARWRLTERRFPDSTSVSYLYATTSNVTSDVAPEPDEIWVTGSIDQNANQTFKLANFRGSPLRVIDEKGYPTRYAYDAFDTLSSITDAAGNVTTVTTDALGRVTSHEDGDTGKSTTAYTAFGEMFEFTDGVGSAAPRLRRYAYDDAGRLVTIDATEGRTSFSYDHGPNAMGRLDEMMGPSGNVEHYDYQDPTGDPLSNLAYLKGITREIAGASFSTSLTYDSDKHLLEKVDLPASTDGKAFAVLYEYDDVGFLKAVKGTSRDGSSEDALFWQRGANYQGQAIATETFGNGVTSAYGYEDKTGRLKSLATKDPAEAILQDVQYTLYDGNGNLKTRTSSFRDVGATELDVVEESFDYDELDRLTTITAGGSIASVAYNGIGNITGKTGLGTYDYTEAGKVTRPHAVQNVRKSGRKVLDLEYDDFGNVTHRSGDDVEGESQDIAYNSFNLPTQVTLGSGSQVRYQYDASQRRVLVDVGDCTDPTSATCNRRVYAGEGYERQTATDEAGTFTRDIYKVFAGGQQVAQVQRESRSASSTETRRFIHGDHLGSSQLITDEEGSVVSLRRFNAFGELTSASSPDAASSGIRAGFTGHETDVETGLINMRGRIYDPKLGRFLQADIPFAEAPVSQGLNRYSYAFNNPLRFTDPSGFAGEDESGDPPPSGGGGIQTCNEWGGCVCWGTEAECGDGPPDSATGTEGASSDPSGGESQAMAESSESASNATTGTTDATDATGDSGRSATEIAREVAHTGANATLGYGEGAVPFASLWSLFNPPSDPRDRFERGAGQLAGSFAAFGTAGGLAGAGAVEAATVIGIPPAIATEVAAVVVGVGAIANAGAGIYNMMMGDSGAGTTGGTPGPSGHVSTEKFLEKRWDKATFPTVKKSIEYHVAKHGKGLSAVQYTQRAEAAFSHPSAVKIPTTDIQGREAIRLQSDLGNGLFTPQGKIIWFHPAL